MSGLPLFQYQGLFGPVAIEAAVAVPTLPLTRVPAQPIARPRTAWVVLASTIFAPVYIPDVTAPSPVLAARSHGPDWLRRARPVPAFPAFTNPIDVPGVQVPSKSWGSTGPDWLRLASRLTPHDTGWTAPLHIADVTVVAPDLSWRGEQPTFVLVARRPPSTDLDAVEPIETSGVQVPFLSGRSIGPEWLRLARRLTPADIGLAVAPIYIPDVTAPAPDRSWAPAYPDRLDRRTAREPLGLQVTDPTTPSAALVVWYGSIPDLPIRRPWAAAVWGPRTVGAAGLLNVGPGFSAAVPLPYRVIQYTALVGPLDVVVAPAPDLFTLPATDVMRRLAVGRWVGLYTGPVEPPAVVPAPDLAIVVGEIPRAAPSFFTRVQTLGIPVEPPPPAPDLSQTTVGLFPYGRRPVTVGPSWSAPPPPPIIPTTAWSLHADPQPRRPIVYRWPFYFSPGLPTVPAVPAPIRGDWAFGGLPPRSPARVIDRLWWTGPLRVADVTAAVPELSWKGSGPDWVARRAPVRTGTAPITFSAALANLDPSRFGWRGVRPDWIARRRPTQPRADLLLSPSPFPVPDLGWAGSFPARLFSAPRVQGPVVSFDPEPLPNAASPDLAWQGSAPAWFAPRSWVRPPATILRPAHEIVTIPDLVSLVIAPAFVLSRVLPSAARAVITHRLLIDQPDLRRDWAGIGVDRTCRLVPPPPSQRFWVAEGDRAISPVDWWGSRPDRAARQPRLPLREGTATLPPQGEAITVGQQLRWRPDLPTVTRRLFVLNPSIVSPTVIPPEIPGAGEPCVELGEGTLTSPILLSPILGSPGLLNGILTTPTLLSPEVC